MYKKCCYIIDHQGNLTATIHGNTVERLSYDAWGRRRNPVGFGYSNVSHTFDRGYTLHEHYDDFDLINMNGRLYDPVLGRMLSPDIAIQDEHNAQAYNRYSYCFNNPLRFTDPSGYMVRMPFEYYGIETFSYSYLGSNTRKGSSFNTEATEGMQRPDDDWFENEETGAVYYNSNMHKGDEGQGRMKGSGWKWLGKNGMFSESFIGLDSYLVANYGGLIGINDNGTWEMELFLNGKKAKSMMETVGYMQVSTQVIVYSKVYDQMFFDGKHYFHFTQGISIDYTEKVGYVPKNYRESARFILGSTLYGPLDQTTGSFPEVSRFSIVYDKPSYGKRIGQFLKIINGYHDNVFYYNEGNIKNAKLEGEKGELIRKFLAKP